MRVPRLEQIRDVDTLQQAAVLLEKTVISQQHTIAKLKVENNKLVAIRIPEADQTSKGVNVTAMPGAACDALRIDEPRAIVAIVTDLVRSRRRR